MGESKPFAFLSYSHDDDRALGGAITKFREALATAVRTYIGEDELQLFQDWAAIGWGEQWRQRIQEELNEVTFLIPILTPRFFNRTECREELALFLRREQTLGRTDLVLPVYFVEYDALEDEVKRRDDELAATMAERQWVDWRELRHSLPQGSGRLPKKLRIELENLAKEMVRALRRTGNDTDRTAPTTVTDIGGQELGSAGDLAGIDTADTVESVALTEPVAQSGTLETGAGEFYTAVLAAAVPYYIYVRPDDPTVDFDLMIYDEDDNLVAQDSDARSDAYCEITPRWTGPFRLLVSSARGNSTYSLIVSPKAFVFEGEGEPTSGQGSTDLEGPQVYASALVSGEADFLDIMLEAGRTYQVYVRPDDPSVDFDLQIFDENDVLVAEDVEQASEAECLITPRWTGPFRLEVTSASGASAYRLFILTR
jgi:hypothetical protein